MASYDIAIRNGTIVDGARTPRYQGDIGIKDGVITRMAPIAPGEGEREIDATGLVVAPGFIDLHTHYDAQVFWDPYLTTSGWNGVTSVVVGNCGFGFAPCKEELRGRAMQSMTKVEAIPLATLQAALPWDWETYPEMLDSIDRAPKAVNLLPYMGVNPLLIWVLGLEDAKAGRKPTADEHAEIDVMLAHTRQPDAKIGDEIDWEVTPANFGRIAAQTASSTPPAPLDQLANRCIFFFEKIHHIQNF